MNRVLLLLLSVLSLNLFGKVILPETYKTAESASLQNLQTKRQNQDSDAKTLRKPQQKMLMDTVPPVIICPDSEVFTLAHGHCDTVLTYAVTATDDQGPAIVIPLAGLASGSVFPIGVSTIFYLATDLSGNTATCSFSFTVDDAGVGSLDCDDLITVDLDANCIKTVFPQEVLEGGPYGCWNRYVVEIDKTAPFGNGPWLGPNLNAVDRGKTYQVRVIDGETGNKCWGDVKIQDKIGPVLVCQDFTVSCAQEQLLPEFLRDSLGIPTAIPSVSDACGSITFLGHVDNTTPLFCDSVFSSVINRQWQANDDNGNTSTCIQHINQHRHTLDEMQLPPDVTLNCPDTNANPDLTGFPFLMYQGRRFDMVNSSICDISAFYEDIQERLPCGDIQIRRNWELFDFCSGVTEGPFVQNIYILDETSPIIICPASLLVNVNADTCHGLVELPDVILDDVCSQLATFQAFWEEDGLSKNLMGSLGTFMGNDSTDFDTLGVMGMAVFPVGTTMISYVTEDSCGNIGDCSFNLTVADMDLPTARCDTFSSVQLSPDGTVTYPANFFDNGSSDACTALQFKARFLEHTACLFDTIWTDSLSFCCLNQNDTLDAMLRVYDIPVPLGTVSPSFGNGHFRDCAMKIRIVDQNPPSCVAPQNLTVDCDDFDPTLQTYGNVTSISCAVDSIIMEVDYSLFDTDCNSGTLTRIFKVFDAAGNIGGCAQAVKVNYLQDYFIKFPDDVILTVCDGTGNYGQPTFFGQDCEDFDVDYTDEVFTIVPDACYKIERTWTISNKCTYDPLKPFIVVPNPTPSAISNSPSNLPGPIVSACNALPPWSPSSIKINPTDVLPTNFCTFWDDLANGYQFKQIIKIIDAQAPSGVSVVPTCTNQNWNTGNNAQFWNEVYWVDPQIGGSDRCEEPLDLSITATDACSGSNINIEYLLFMDLDGNGSTETVVNSVAVGTAGLGWNHVLYDNLNSPNFMGGTSRAFDERPVLSNKKMGFAIEETVSGNNKTARVRWNTQEQPNTYFDAEIPHGSHKIKWFVTDNCGNNKEYEHSFTVRDCKVPTVICNAPLTANINASGLANMQANNFLQLTEDNCTPTYQIELGIRKCGTGMGFPINGQGNPNDVLTYTCNELGVQCVELWAIDKAGNADFCTVNLTIQDTFQHCNAPANGYYGWTRTELGDPIENALVEIHDSIQFLPPLFNTLTDSLGYFKIPSNIPHGSNAKLVPEKDDLPLNGVTTFDLVLISKHILGTEPLNSPFKMIAADANRSRSITSFDIVEFRKLILGIHPELPNNTSWRFVDSAFVFPNPQNPFQTVFPEVISISAGVPYSFTGVKVGDVNNTSVPNLNAIAEERFEGLVFLDTEAKEVKEGELIELNFKTSEQLEGCQFTLETNGLEILEIVPGAGLSKENFGQFPKKSMLTMAWETGGEANFSLKMKALKGGAIQEMIQLGSQITRAEAYKIEASSKSRLALRFGKPGATFDLLQNQPNPFEHKTAITFQLPQASDAMLTVLDGTGKTLWSNTGNFPAGLNTIEIDLSGISDAGVLYYKLETPTEHAVRKMIRI